MAKRSVFPRVVPVFSVRVRLRKPFELKQYSLRAVTPLSVVWVESKVPRIQFAFAPGSAKLPG